MTKYDLSVIVVTYNSAKQISPLLDSLKKSKDNLKKEIIIIDNQSEDETVKLIESHSQKVFLIKSRTNLGFSKAVNLAIKKATGKYIFLLNPDTKIIGNSLQKLYRFAQQNFPLGAVVPRLVNSDGRPQASAFHFPTITNAFRAYFFNQDKRYKKYLPPNKISQLEVAVMAAFFIPRSTIETVGLLSEKFFLYYEDIDYCRRLFKAKLPLYYLPSAKVEHIHGASGKSSSHVGNLLFKSAKIYHGIFYFYLLNLILKFGQKWQQVKIKKYFFK